MNSNVRLAGLVVLNFVFLLALLPWATVGASAEDPIPQFACRCSVEKYPFCSMEDCTGEEGEHCCHSGNGECPALMCEPN